MLFWTIIVIPLAIMLLLFAYSDQAPTGLRDAVAALDHELGYPIQSLIKMIAAR